MRYDKAMFTSKNLQNCDEPHFHDKQDPKKMGTFVFFLKYKIENNGFITILGSALNKGMMPTTIFVKI